MKDVVKVKKEEKKLFTKKESNSTIKKNYNPFEVDCKIYRRRDGLYMKSIILKEIRKELDWKVKIVSYIFPKTFIKIYGIAIQKAMNNVLI